MIPELGIAWHEQAWSLPVITIDANLDDVDAQKILVILCLN